MAKSRIALWTLAAALGAIIATRWLLGPYALLGIPVHVPLNPEGAFGFVISLLLATSGPSQARASARGFLAPLLSALLALAALYPALHVGFLSDDFILIQQARHFTPSIFSTPGGDGFFRPLGYLSLDLTALRATADPRLWHLAALVLHAANAALVAAFAARLNASTWIACLAGSLFALHGTHLEAAVWIAGRFDLLAVLFTLATLLFFTRNTPAALACTLAALWSKESAYVLPALLTLLAWHERKPLRATLPYWALTAVAFLYRAILLGGIGGYTNPSGESAFFSLKVATTAKVVFVRLWTSLYFPLNWSQDPSLLAAFLATAYIATLLWMSLRSHRHPSFRMALAGLAISILPPLHLLGGAADLSGGRLLYLPSIFFCLLLAFAASGLEWRRAIAVSVVLLTFHLAALRHDLPFWQRAADQVRSMCEQRATNPPQSIDGVPALANGYSECTNSSDTDPANR